MLGDARVGTSGFAYREWLGSGYPPDAPGGQMLPLYAERLAGVELASFPPDLAEAWAASVPPGFQFALKAPGRVASELVSGKGAARALAAFLEIAERFGEALGPILIQVPASRTVDRNALGTLLASLPDGLRVAFDFK